MPWLICSDSERNQMTVRELIEKLKEMPLSAEISVSRARLLDDTPIVELEEVDRLEDGQPNQVVVL